MSADDAAPVEAEGGGTDVVLDDARAPERGLERVAERQVRPAEVDGEGHVAGQRVDPAGDADADRGDVVRRRAGVGEGRCRRRRRSRRRHRPGLRPRSGATWRAEDALVAIDDEDRDLAAADVDADEEPAVAVGGHGPSSAVVGHRCTVRPSSRVSSSAHAPRSVRSSPTPPSMIRVSRASGPRLRRVGLVADRRQPRLAEGGDACRGRRSRGRRGCRSGWRPRRRAPGRRRA